MDAARLARAASAATPVGVALASAAALAFVALVDPNEPGNYPTCPFHAVTGLWCPGCGSLRALHALTHGHVMTAMGFNVLTIAVLPLLVVAFTRWTMRVWTGSPRRLAVHPTYIWGVFALVVAFGVVRNLPWGGVLAP
jgi:hypothetical protein